VLEDVSESSWVVVSCASRKVWCDL